MDTVTRCIGKSRQQYPDAGVWSGGQRPGFTHARRTDGVWGAEPRRGAWCTLVDAPGRAGAGGGFS